jgi:hypothetical protein
MAANVNSLQLSARNHDVINKLGIVVQYKLNYDEAKKANNS